VPRGVTRRVVITGASSGIGRALAVAWGSRGASVVLAARDARVLDEVAGDVRAAGGEAYSEPCDITREEDRARLVERSRAAMGGIDVLVNNAGKGYYAAIRDLDLAEVEALFAVNVFAPLRLTQLALPHLAADEGPRAGSTGPRPVYRPPATVVMLSSVAGVVAAPKMGAYAASKFALEALSLSLRAEAAGSGVKVLVVRPGPVDTPFRANAFTRNAEAGVRPPGARAQTARDIAETTIRAVESGRAVVETSLFVQAASFASRVTPPVFRRIAARMAKG